jgi:hypothetical protein
MRFDDSPVTWRGAACVGHPSQWWFALPWFRSLRPAGSPPLTRWEARTRERERAQAKRDHALALRVCVSCPLVVQCAEWGLAREAAGVWGGITEWERFAIGGVGTPLANKQQPSLEAALVAISRRFGRRAREIRPVITPYVRQRLSRDEVGA